MKLLIPIYNNRVFFVFMYLLGALCIYTTGEKSYLPYFVTLFAELFLDLYLLCLLLLCFPPKVRSFCHFTLSFLFYSLAIVDLFCFYRFGTTISPNILRLITETNSTEASEFLHAYITTGIILSPLGLIFLLILLHIHIVFLSFPKLPLKINSSFSLYIIIFILLIGIISAAKNKRLLIQTWKYKSISEIENFFGTEFYASRAQYLPIYRMAFALHASNMARQQVKTLIQTIDNAKIDSCSFTSPNIILIIGESYNKHHSQLYGYTLPTTPKQLEWKEKEQLFVFNDAIAPYNITSDVFKCMFSLNNISEGEEWCDKPLFTCLFKQAGYHVSFISNEFVLKKNENFADFSGSMFINDPQISDLQFDTRNKETHSFDEELINDYKSMNQKEIKNRLTIFTLMGQHVEYKDRFPKAYTKFSAKDYKRNDLTNKEKQIIADYDNATLYNDIIVNSIIQLFAHEDAIIIYISDHGEECYDEIKTFGRLHHFEISKYMAKNEFQIPFWIWCSESYKGNHPDIVKAIIKSSQRPFISDNLSHLLLYLGGITCPYYQDELNIISSKYINKKRLLRGSYDYDKIMQTTQK